jgi:DNA-binding MarR family transcriptional regulator
MIVIPSISAIALRALTVETVRAGSILQREAGRLFRASKVSAAQFNVINLLAAKPGGVRASELALSLVVDPSSTTYILDQLEERGLVTRKRDTDDRRALKVVLTAAGKRLHAALIPVYHRALQRMADSFTAEELAGALPFLERLPAVAVESIDAVLAEGAPARSGKTKKAKSGVV